MGFLKLVQGMKPKKIMFILAILPFIIFLILLHSCMQFRLSDSKIQKEFENLPIKPQIHYYEVLGKKMRYLDVGNPQNRLILWVHGSPGSSSDFLKYLKDADLLAKYRLVAVDRVGYGYSDFGNSETSLHIQAQLIAPLLDLNQHQKAPILVGYSYGGAIIGILAHQYPEKTAQMLMLACALDPDNEQFFWVNKPADWRIFKGLVPAALRVANDEKLAHVAQLRQIAGIWKELKNPTTFVHGYKDYIVPIANSQFALKEMSNAPTNSIFKKNLDHLLIWKEYTLIKELLMKMD